MMFVTNQFLTLFAYHWQTTYRLMDCAGTLTESAYHENNSYGHGGIHTLFFHLLRTSHSWRVSLEIGQQPTGLPVAEFPTLAAVRAGIQAEQAAWQRYLESLTPEQITSNISLTNWRGEPFVIPLWRILQHLIIHGMQHHSELASLLTIKGQSPGNLDFIFFQ